MRDKPVDSAGSFSATVRIDQHGAAEKVCSGSISCRDAEKIAVALVELAAAIRAEARREIAL